VLSASTATSTGFFDGYYNLWRFDVRRPEEPRRLTTWDTAADLERLAVGSGFILAAGVSGGGGTHVIDLGQPTAPRLGTQLAADTMLSEALAASPGLVAQLVVLGFDSELRLTVPGRGLVSRLALPEGLNRDGGASTMAIAGDVVYALPFGRQLMIVDAARPDQPAVLATVPARGEMRAVAVYGDRVVVAEASTSAAPEAGSLRLLDVHDPAAPVEAGRAEGSFGSVALAGGYVVAGSAAEPLVQVFAAEPAGGAGSLAPVGSLVLERPARELVAAGSRVYALDTANTLHVLDLSDPTRPRHEGSLGSSQGWSGSGAFEHLAARGDVVYAGNRAHQLYTIDAATPSAPRLVAERRLPGPPDLAVAERVLTGGEVAAAGWDVLVAGDLTGVWSFGAGTLPGRTEPFEGLFWANFEHSRFSPAANGCAPDGEWWYLPIGAFPDLERRYGALYPGYRDVPPRVGPGYAWLRFEGAVSPPTPAGHTWWLDRGVAVTRVLDMWAVPGCAFAPPPGTGTPVATVTIPPVPPTPSPTDVAARWRLWLPWLVANRP
jgi:hypothetical protein